MLLFNFLLQIGPSVFFCFSSVKSKDDIIRLPWADLDKPVHLIPPWTFADKYQVKNSLNIELGTGKKYHKNKQEERSSRLCAILTVKKSMSGMLLNPPIVWTCTRQRWSSTYHLQFKSSFAGLKIKYTHYISSTYFFHLATIYLLFFNGVHVKRYTIVLTVPWTECEQKTVKYLSGCVEMYFYLKVYNRYVKKR
jgi:hypothetical protein